MAQGLLIFLVPSLRPPVPKILLGKTEYGGHFLHF